jgi:hypothetical protein
MSNRFTVYGTEALATIHAMRSAGAKTAEIAAAIGTTPGSLTTRMNQLGISKRVKRRPDVDPVRHGGRVGTVVKDAGVYHALDADWNHLGWFAEHHEAKRAVRDHHDQMAVAA